MGVVGYVSVCRASRSIPYPETVATAVYGVYVLKKLASDERTDRGVRANFTATSQPLTVYMRSNRTF